jgi:hypothetical protein
MSDEDPKPDSVEFVTEEQPAGWEEDTPLYKLELHPVQDFKGVKVFVGTNYPAHVLRHSTDSGGAPKSVHTFRLIVESEEQITGKKATSLFRQIFKGTEKVVQQTLPFAALKQLGGSDVGGSLPANEPTGWDSAVAFWMAAPNAERPVLAVRSPYRMRNQLKDALEAAHRMTGTRCGEWRPKPIGLWTVNHWEGIPIFMGHLMVKEKIRITWVARPGFPPAPPPIYRGT